jgi:hypothetical protein
MSEAREIADVIKLVLEDAHSKREGAAFMGERGDRGASTLEMQVRFYKYGLNAELPTEWVKYSAQLDPEYKQYLELKKKFEGRV